MCQHPLRCWKVVNFPRFFKILTWSIFKSLREGYFDHCHRTLESRGSPEFRERVCTVPSQKIAVKGWKWELPHQSATADRHCILQAAWGHAEDQKQSLQTEGWPWYQPLSLCVKVLYSVQNPVQNTFSVRLNLSLIRCVFENSWRRGVMEEGQCHPSVPKGQERPAGCAAIQPDLDRLEKNSGKLS